MEILKIVFQVILVLASALLVLLILLHKGRDGGLSDMFGGGIASSAGSSGVAKKNLNRFTLLMSVLWAVSVVFIGVIEKMTT
ncbi:MAG: preprotein translocase subunit SecG [Candidatus Ancillula trichonymphae]|jgi:preprotein translocase subunit SecG|nr:preprotein translocase subunit SecG [Candidatus Ancillula trichonymphae]